jgi:hypothetical protein
LGRLVGYKGVGTLNYGNAVAVSPSGKTVFVTGESDSKDFLAQYATVAYNAATGAQQWIKLYYGPGSDNGYSLGYAVAVSPTSGTVIVTGYDGGSGQYATVAYKG